MKVVSVEDFAKEVGSKPATLEVDKEHDKLRMFAEVYPIAPTDLFDDDDWASMEIEDPGALENIKGVVDGKSGGTYSVAWVDMRTGEKSEVCCMKCAWFEREELTTDREKYLAVYHDWKSRFDPSLYSKAR